MAYLLNKWRVYRCPCGGLCVRGLHGDPKPCEQCDQPIGEMSFTIEDRHRFRERVLDGTAFRDPPEA